jgi:site-specific recombinase XerD
VTNDLEQVLTAYESWLPKQPLAKKTQEAYRFHVRKFWDYLATRPTTGDDALHDAFARDYAVRDFKRYLKTERNAKPASVNLALAAIDHFYQFLGLGRVRVQREELPQQSPGALKPEEQKAFLRAVERNPSLRDQALARLLFYTGLRLSECATLDQGFSQMLRRVHEE